jgi:putative membrane protein
MKRGAMYLLMAGLLVFYSCNQRDQSGNNNGNDDSKDVAEEQNEDKFDNKMEKDADFAVKAAEDNMLEIRLSELAESNASSSEVKSFAKSIIADHTKASEELKQLALQKGITLPASLSDKSQRKYDDIAKKSGREFDEAYSDYMVKDHKDAVDNFEKEAEKGNDPDMKAFAAKNIQTMQHHLAMAEDLEDMVKKANRASNER